MPNDASQPIDGDSPLELPTRIVATENPTTEAPGHVEARPDVEPPTGNINDSANHPPQYPAPPKPSDLALIMAYWIHRLLAARGTDDGSAYSAAIAAIRELDAPNALRAARAILGPLPHPVARVIRDHVELRGRKRSPRIRLAAVSDEYGPSTKARRFRRLQWLRLLMQGGERYETRTVMGHCPVCRKITQQSLELNVPFFVAVTCRDCPPKGRSGSRVRRYAPPPFYLHDERGPDGIMRADVDGAIAVLMNVVSQG